MKNFSAYSKNHASARFANSFCKKKIIAEKSLKKQRIHTLSYHLEIIHIRHS